MSGHPAVVVLADDLTGALDATAAFGRRRRPAEVWLHPPLPRTRQENTACSA